MMVRSLGLIVTSLLLAMLVFAPHRAAAQDAFYQASEKDFVGPPGSIIRQESMPGAPDGASAYRVLYRSTDMHGAPIAVSGIVIVPAGLAQDSGRPVIAWAHPTTGVVPRCGPSLAMFVFQQIAGLREAVARLCRGSNRLSRPGYTGAASLSRR